MRKENGAIGYSEFKKELDFIFQKFSSKDAVVNIRESGSERITYGEIYRQIQDLEKLLEWEGLHRADRIAVIAQHNGYSVITVLSLVYLGYTVVPMDVSLSRKDLKHLLDIADVNAAFVADDKWNDIIIQNIPIFEMYCEERSLKKISSTEGNYCPTVPTNPDVMAILFSSGTTGTMKGVEVTWEGIIKACEYMREYTNLNSEIHFFNVLPFSHIAGFSSVMSCFLTGAETGYVPQVDAGWLSVGFREYKPTNFIMIPKVYEIIKGRILTEIKRKRIVNVYFQIMYRLSAFVRRCFGLKLRCFFLPVLQAAMGKNILICGCGTAPCHKELVEFYLNLGIDFVNVYGSTETGFPITATNCKKSHYDIDSVGYVNQFEDIEICIFNPDADGCGEIRVKSPLIMRGYFREPELTASAFDRNGYFKTGDIGYIDTDKHLHITGRLKEVILLQNGKKVSPDEVDTFYSKICGNIKHACCGIPIENGCDEIHFFLERFQQNSEELELCKKKLLKESNENATLYKLSQIHIVEKIPVTSVGKVKRVLLKDLIDVPLKQSAILNGDTSDKLDSIKEIIWEVIGRSDLEIDEECDLVRDLGFDSLSLMELCSKLEEQYHINFIYKLNMSVSVRDILELIEKPDECLKRDAENKSIDIYPQKKTGKDYLIIRLFAKLSYFFWKYSSVHSEVVQSDKRYILCPNHESHLDSLWILSALCHNKNNMERFCCMAADYLLKNPILKTGFHALGGIPVSREDNPILATERAKEYLQENNCLMLIHPEGTRTRTGEMGEFKLGAAQLAIETNTDIIPVCIKGARQIYPSQRKFPKLFNFHTFQRYEIKILFGDPISPHDKNVHQITEEVRRQIIFMKEKE